MKRSLLFFFAFIYTASSFAQQPLKRIYLANDDHTDYMWTGNEMQYDSAFVHMLDYYIAQMDSTAGHPDDYQARYNCDGSYWLKTYQKYRTEQQFDKLIGYIKSGHMSSPLNALVSIFGCQPTEAVLRGMYYAGQLERKYQLRFLIAIAMENQTLPMGLSSLWAGSGAKYSWKGVCECASRMTKKSLGSRKHQIYHSTGPDNRSVLMKWYNHSRLGGGSRSLGGYAETRLEMITTDVFNNINPRIAELDALCDSSAQYPYRAAGAFGYGSDDLENYNSPVFIKVAQANTSPERRVRISNQEDFFKDIEQHYKKIPSMAVTYGNEWDLYPASMNETVAQVRRATEKMRTAESIATLVSVKDTAFGKNLDAAKNRAWDVFGLFWEHDWTADGLVSRQERADWQIKLKNNLSSYIDSLYDQSSRALGSMIKAAVHTRFYAYNSLSWKRSDFADMEYEGTLPVVVTDLTSNKEIPSQVITRSGKIYIRIWAENVPPVGYKVYELKTGIPSAIKSTITYKDGFLQNRFYRIKIENSGSISAIYDLRAGNRQLVKKDAGRLLNDLGTSHHENGTSSVEEKGNVSFTVRSFSSDPIAHIVKTTLYENSPRIDIEDSIVTNFGDIRTWSFPFALNKQTTRFEEIGAVLTARKESRGGHYAEQNARYDWISFNHFANMSEKNYGVTLSNQDCNFFQLGNSTPDSLWEDAPQLNALAGGQIDGERLGILKQNGNTAFRYSFSLITHSGAFKQEDAMRFSLEHQNPLVTAKVTGIKNVYPSALYSFLSVTDPGILLWSLKPSEEGIEQGIIARFWNLKTITAKPQISTKQALQSIWQTTHIETNERQLMHFTNGFKAAFAPQQINTYRLLLH